jgi:hypothetical protein
MGKSPFRPGEDWSTSSHGQQGRSELVSVCSQLCQFEPVAWEARAFAGVHGFPADPGQAQPCVDDSTAKHALLIGERNRLMPLDAGVSYNAVRESGEEQKPCRAQDNNHAFCSPFIACFGTTIACGAKQLQYTLLSGLRQTVFEIASAEKTR